MAAPENALIKSWCRIDGTEHDAVLPTLIASATAVASHEVGVDYTTTVMPESVQIWCAAQVAHWIANPEAAVEKTSQRNLFLNGLLDPHRVYL